jgi:hypothetical protein
MDRPHNAQAHDPIDLFQKISQSPSFVFSHLLLTLQPQFKSTILNEQTHVPLEEDNKIFTSQERRTREGWKRFHFFVPKKKRSSERSPALYQPSFDFSRA